MNNSKHRKNFIKWYVRPFNRLKRTRRGDGAFIILSMGLFLCERYYRIRSNSIKKDGLPDKFHKMAARDFGCTPALFKRFWLVYRHGIQHRGQPQRWIMETQTPGTPKKKVRVGWLIDDSFLHRPTECLSRGKKTICVDPEKFTRFVLWRFLKNEPALGRSIRHQFGSIFPMSAECQCR